MGTSSYYQPAGAKGWSRPAVPKLRLVIHQPIVSGVSAETVPDQLFRWESLAAPPLDNAEPYTLQWYLAIEHQRHARQARWIPKLFDFAKHAGETFLGLGHGLGTDWVPFARHGARVIACTHRSAELALIKQNFELRGLTGRFVHADPTALPLADASVDVACVNGLLHEMAEPIQVVQEVWRVLKPGGKVLAVVPARYQVDYWRRFLPWSGLGPTTPAISPWQDQQRSVVEYSSRRLRKLFGDFTDPRVHKRQLSRREIPWGWRWLPRAWMERVMGRLLILKAFKPLTVAMPLAAAA